MILGVARKMGSHLAAEVGVGMWGEGRDEGLGGLL